MKSFPIAASRTAPRRAMGTVWSEPRTDGIGVRAARPVRCSGRVSDLPRAGPASPGRLVLSIPRCPQQDTRNDGDRGAAAETPARRNLAGVSALTVVGAGPAPMSSALLVLPAVVVRAGCICHRCGKHRGCDRGTRRGRAFAGGAHQVTGSSCSAWMSTSFFTGDLPHGLLTPVGVKIGASRREAPTMPRPFLRRCVSALSPSCGPARPSAPPSRPSGSSRPRRIHQVVNALDMASRNRRPAPGGIVHADHGVQFILGPSPAASGRRT